MIEEIEQIKQVKARYFRLMDQKRWDEWKELFTEDVIAVYHGVPRNRRSDGFTEVRCDGRADLVTKVSGFLAKGITVHHGHTPEIEVTSPTTARGIWALEDQLWWPEGGPVAHLHGFGHYHETYKKTDAGWRIKTLTITRLHRLIDR